MTYDIIPSGTVATANLTSNGFNIDAVPTRGTKVLSITAVKTSLNTSDATLRLQHSNDDVNYENIDSEDSTVGLLTLTSGTGTQSLTPVTYLGMNYYRVVYTKNTNSAGTIKVIINVS
jgi:hypothetical protein